MINRVKRSVAGRLRWARGRLAMSLGRTRSTTPLSTNFGFSRGTPIDRHYIERYIEAHAADIRGHVLEVGDNGYSRCFGGNRITRQDILDLDGGNSGATIVGDLTAPGVLPLATFDCVIMTQTLHLIFDMAAAVEQICRSLRPGGVALITVPGITPIDRGEWKDRWYWSLTGQALQRVLCGAFDPANVSVTCYGNLFAATAFLHGAALQEVSKRKLDAFDPAFPVIVAGRAIA